MILINENYKIESDDTCYTLYERKITKKGEENWQAVSYHKNLLSTLKKYRNKNIKKLIRSGDDINIDDLIHKLIDERGTWNDYVELEDEISSLKVEWSLAMSEVQNEMQK